MTELLEPAVAAEAPMPGICAGDLARMLVPAAGRTFLFAGIAGLIFLGVSLARADQQPCCVVGDPISLNTGDMFHEDVDYITEGADKLEFIRIYHSLAFQTYGPLAPLGGIAWRSTYDRYLVMLPNGAGALVAERANGQILKFKVANGVAAPDSDVDLTLVQIGDGWVLTDSDGTVETYGPPDQTGRSRVLRTKAPNGYTQTLSYNAANQLVSVTDSHDRVLKFAYDGESLSTVTTPDGETLTYSYDSSIPALRNDRLISVTYSKHPDKTLNYLYDNTKFPNLLIGVTDAAGTPITTWTFDECRRGISSLHGDRLTTVSYGLLQPGGILINTMTQGDEQTVYKFKILQHVPKVIEIDRLASAKRPASTELYTYDANGYLISTTDGNGRVTTYTPQTHSAFP